MVQSIVAILGSLQHQHTTTICHWVDLLTIWPQVGPVPSSWTSFEVQLHIVAADIFVALPILAPEDLLAVLVVGVSMLS